MLKPAQVDYALFDFDGVIADTEPFFLELDRQALVRLGYTPTDAEVHSFVGHPSEIMAQALLAQHGISIDASDFLAERNVSTGIYGNPDLDPMPGLGELWARLSEKGIKIAVVSSTRVADLVRALNRWGLLTYVDAVVGREYVEKTKPDPEPYRIALELLAPAANDAQLRAVAFEDSPTGIASAVAAGVYVFGFTGNTVPQDVSAADGVCSSFEGFEL